MRDLTTAIYTNASAKNKDLKAAIVILDANDTVYKAK
jgi:hypothetical protein